MPYSDLYSRSAGDLYGQSLNDPHTVDELMFERLNITTLLGRYFTLEKIGEFRELQFHTGMFIAGSTVLQYFDAKHYDDANLDLYLDHKHRSLVADWFIGAGYSFQPSPTNPTETLATVLSKIPDDVVLEDSIVKIPNAGNDIRFTLVIDFYHYERGESVRLVTSKLNPLQMVLSFHSSTFLITF